MTQSEKDVKQSVRFPNSGLPSLWMVSFSASAFSFPEYALKGFKSSIYITGRIV
jgi:hypothetical protein